MKIGGDSGDMTKLERLKSETIFKTVCRCLCNMSDSVMTGVVGNLSASLSLSLLE